MTDQDFLARIAATPVDQEQIDADYRRMTRQAAREAEEQDARFAMTQEHLNKTFNL